MVKLQDFARQMGVTDRMIQKHLRTYAAELEGHYERKGPNGTWLDEEAQDIIRSKMKQAPIAVYEEDPRVKRQQAEIDDLREQLKKKDDVLYDLIEKNETLQLQLNEQKLLTAGKEEADRKAAEAEKQAIFARQKEIEAETALDDAKKEYERELETVKCIADANEQEAAAYKKYAEDLEAYLNLPFFKRLTVKKPTFDGTK